MDWLTFISSVVSSIAWPVAIMVVAAFGRKPFGRFLDNSRRLKVKYKGVEIGLERELQELVITADPVIREIPIGPERTVVEDKRLQLAVLSPRGAILETWIDFEEFLRHTCISKGIEIKRGAGVRGHLISLESTEMAKRLHEAGVLGPTAINVIEQLKNVRNKAVHVTDQAITYAMAKDFIDVATGLKTAIEETIPRSLPTA
jgi:hypothetical protein